jgi:hypothetical protein
MSTYNLETGAKERDEIDQRLPPSLLPDPDRASRWCEPFLITIPAGTTFVFQTRILPQYYLVAEAGTGDPFSVCYGPDYIAGKAIPLASGGRAKLPATNHFLSILAGPADAVVLILAYSGYPETDYNRRNV